MSTLSKGFEDIAKQFSEGLSWAVAPLMSSQPVSLASLFKSVAETIGLAGKPSQTRLASNATAPNFSVGV